MLVLQFISGVYIAFDSVPQWLQQVASLFPLKWIAQGMRSVFYPSQLASAEMAGAWETGRTALVLAAWAVGGLVAVRADLPVVQARHHVSAAGATMAGVTTGASSREEFGAMWRRQQPYWHAVFAIVWTAASS